MADGFVEITQEQLDTPGGIVQLNRMFRQLYELVAGDGKNVKIYYGYGTPESIVVASPGAIYLNRSGGANTSIYVKESGTGGTGWIPK